MRRKILTVPNPTRPGGRKPVELISDRAKRYRAVKAKGRPGRSCEYCGARFTANNPRMVDHADGDEANNEPNNLADACRSCNTKKGNEFRRAGVGKPVNQWNPGKNSTITRRSQPSYKQWAYWGAVVDGKAEGDRDAAAKAIRAMPKSLRSEYVQRSWQVRRERYGPSGRQMSFDDVPF